MSSIRRLLAHPDTRDIGLWALLGILVLVELAALWMVCLGQVRQAQARYENRPAEQRAIEDCVRHNSKDSLVRCADQATDRQPAAAAATRPVGFGATAR